MRTSRVPGVLGVLGVLAALVVPFLATSPTSAAGASVTVADMAFSSASVRVGLGKSVTWSFQDPVAHTVTSDDGFFDTVPTSGGATRTIRFVSAGAFPYHCSIHPMMHGKVTVPMTATGSVEDGWKLRWLAGDSPRSRSYDVQVRRTGRTTWTSFEKGATVGSGRFDPGAGSWQARARTVKRSGTSGWSPVLDLP